MKPPKDKREAILQAMLEFVAERGFHNAPMSLVAKRAGTSAGIIYHYFPSKDPLRLRLRAAELLYAADSDCLCEPRRRHPRRESNA